MSSNRRYPAAPQLHPGDTLLRGRNRVTITARCDCGCPFTANSGTVSRAHELLRAAHHRHLDRCPNLIDVTTLPDL